MSKEAFIRGDAAVPIIITHRTVSKPPVIEHTKEFVGFKKGFTNLISKAKELIKESFWEEKREIKENGKTKIVHYAVDVADDDGFLETPSLIATKIEGESRPACGMHYEVIRVRGELESTDESSLSRSNAKITFKRPTKDDLKKK